MFGTRLSSRALFDPVPHVPCRSRWPAGDPRVRHLRCGGHPRRRVDLPSVRAAAWTGCRRSHRPSPGASSCSGSWDRELLFVLTQSVGLLDQRRCAALAVWEGGLQFSGAFLIAIVTIVWWLRRHPDVPGLTLTDGIVFGLVPGLMVGRIGCYAVGEHLGHTTTFFLGVRYLGGVTREGPDRAGQRHPQHGPLRDHPAGAAGGSARHLGASSRRRGGDDRHVPGLVRDPALPDRLPPGLRRARGRADRRAVPVLGDDHRRSRPRCPHPSAQPGRPRGTW